MMMMFLVVYKYIAQTCDQSLGIRCPLCGQWMPVVCSVDARRLFTGSPSFVHRENSRWTEVLDTFLCGERNG